VFTLGPVSDEGGDVKEPGFKRFAAIVVICALVGALAGIAGSAAAPSKKSQAQAAKKSKKAAAKKQARALRRGFRGGFGPGPGGPMGGPVHAEAIVPKPDGSGFDKITTDAGTLNGVDGTTVDIKEGTDKKTYEESVKIDVGSDAMVVRNHEKAKLSDLKAGDHVRVIQGPKGNAVFAEDDAFIAQEQKEHRGFRHHGHGFGPPGPPPGGPGGYPGDPQGGNENGSAPGDPAGSGSNS
jgi:hypothetical protein